MFRWSDVDESSRTAAATTISRHGQYSATYDACISVLCLGPGTSGAHSKISGLPTEDTVPRWWRGRASVTVFFIFSPRDTAGRSRSGAKSITAGCWQRNANTDPSQQQPWDHDSWLVSCSRPVFVQACANNELHVLEPLLPDKTNFTYNLHSRYHNRQLIRKTAHVNNSNFIIRMLYSNSY